MQSPNYEFAGVLAFNNTANDSVRKIGVCRAGLFGKLGFAGVIVCRTKLG